MASDKIFPHQKAPDISHQLCLRLQRLSIQCWILSWTELFTLMPKKNHPAGFLLTSKWARLKISEISLSAYFGINRHLLLKTFWYPSLDFMSDEEICHWCSQISKSEVVLKGVNAPKIRVKSLIFLDIKCSSKRQRSYRNPHCLATLPAKSIKEQVLQFSQVTEL